MSEMKTTSAGAIKERLAPLPDTDVRALAEALRALEARIAKLEAQKPEGAAQ